MTHSVTREVRGSDGETYNIEIEVTTDHGYRIIHGAMTGGIKSHQLMAEARVVDGGGVTVTELSQTEMASSSYHPVAEALRRVVPTIDPKGLTEAEFAEVVLEELQSRVRQGDV